jgi:hypothetical protein
MTESILAATREVRVRMSTDADRIETVKLLVVPRNLDLVEIDVEQHVLGYIRRAGRVFVALAGERLDVAQECGQSLLWDQAAADLVRSAVSGRARHVAVAAAS